MTDQASEPHLRIIGLSIPAAFCTGIVQAALHRSVIAVAHECPAEGLLLAKCSSIATQLGLPSSRLALRYTVFDFDTWIAWGPLSRVM
jgi:hypothetical protein